MIVGLEMTRIFEKLCRETVLWQGDQKNHGIRHSSFFACREFLLMKAFRCDGLSLCGVSIVSLAVFGWLHRLSYRNSNRSSFYHLDHRSSATGIGHRRVVADGVENRLSVANDRGKHRQKTQLEEDGNIRYWDYYHQRWK